MAEASCSGPSPFKRLVDHQSRDVSHHQDRLRDNTSAGGHHGTFRSVPGNSLQSHNEFGAFMDGSTAFPGATPHHAAGRLAAHAAALEPFHHTQTQSPFDQQSRISSPPGASNWAADFARFASQPQRQPQQASPMPQHFTGRQSSPQVPPTMMAQAFGMRPGMTSMEPNGGLTPLYGPTNGGFMDPTAASAQRPAAEADFDEEMSRWMAAHGVANRVANGKAMEDVDAVMDQMARELEINDHVLDKEESRGDFIAETKVPDAHFTDLGSTEIGNLSHQDELPEEAVQPEDKTRSEVSEAAERLLESVQHESGDKWRNSVFLSLMRDFRDGRKDIVDNEIRETRDDGGVDLQMPSK